MSKSTNGAMWPRTLGKWIIALLALLAAIYFITPILTQYAITSQLERSGMTDVKVGKVSWKPLQPSITLRDISWTTPNQDPVALKSLTLALDIRPMLNQHIQVTELDVKGLTLPISMTPNATIAGFKLSPSEQASQENEPVPTESSAWSFGIQAVSINNSSLTALGLPLPEPIFVPKAHKLFIDSFSIDQFSTQAPKELSEVVFTGKLDELAFDISSTIAPLDLTKRSIAQLELKDAKAFELIKAWIQPELHHSIQGEGAISIALDLGHKQTPTGRTLTAELNIGIPAFETLISESLSETATLNGRDFSMITGASINLSPPSFSASMNSQIQIKELKAKSGEFNATLSEFILQGKLLETEGQLSALEQILPKATSELKIDHLKISHLQKTLFAFNDLSSTAKIDGRRLFIPDLSFNELTLIEQPEPTLQSFKLEKLEFGRNELGEKAMTIAAVAMKNLNSEIILTNEGMSMINSAQSLVKQLPKPNAEKALNSNSAPTQQPVPPIHWTLEQIELTGDNLVVFEDARDGINLKHRLTVNELLIEQLGLSNPTKLKAKASLATGGSLQANGQITIADIKANTQLTGSLQNLALPPLSPYLVPVIGYTASTGLLDGNLNVNMQAGEGENDLKLALHKLELEPADQRIIASLSQELTMPLDLSLSLLKDSDDTIELNIPLTLNEAGMSADIGTIIRQALTKATKNASLSYLKYALQPYGSLLILAEQSNKLLQEMQLVNIPFAQMSASMVEDQRDPAQKIQEVLSNKPSLKIRLCPTATREELQNWPEAQVSDQDEALRTLALQRAQAVKQYFESFDINAGRLFICAPKINDSGQGEVQISL